VHDPEPLHDPPGVSDEKPTDPNGVPPGAVLLAVAVHVVGRPTDTEVGEHATDVDGDCLVTVRLNEPELVACGPSAL
jgi:hypothetical protein